MPEIFKVVYSDKRYPEVLALRQLILRDPLGMTYTQKELDADKGMIFFAYYNDGEILGTVGLEDLGNGKAQLRQMAVHDKTQGQGVGRKIVEALEEHCREAGFKEIHLDSRYNARGFYEKLGYTEYGEIYDKIGLKHIDMKKVL